MSGLLVALWFATIGADRIDFAGGHGPFIMTPFLVLTPFVIASELMRRTMARRPLIMSRASVAYIVTAAVLLCTALLSVFRSIDFQESAAHTMLLVIDVAGTLLVAVLVADREDLETTLARGVIAGLVLFILFDGGEALYWIGRGPELWRLGPMTARFDRLQNVGVLPRVAGAVGDANRAAFVLLFYFFVLARSRLRAWIAWTAMAVCFVLLFATMSRSGAMSAFVAFPIAMLSRRGIPRRAIAVGMLVLTAAIGYLVVKPDVLSHFDRVMQSPFVTRLSTNEGSAQSHFTLIERGVKEGTSSVPNAAFGIGYGNSYLVLQDMFPDNKYGNFHSLYVTMFAEAGVLALICTLVLTLGPVVVGGPWRAMVVGAIAFNIFYQTPTEPAFWFLLALAWMTLPALRRIMVIAPPPASATAN